MGSSIDVARRVVQGPEMVMNRPWSLDRATWSSMISHVILVIGQQRILVVVLLNILQISVRVELDKKWSTRIRQ
jgi:hypothetical protein